MVYFFSLPSLDNTTALWVKWQTPPLLLVLPWCNCHLSEEAHWVHAGHFTITWGTSPLSMLEVIICVPQPLFKQKLKQICDTRFHWTPLSSLRFENNLSSIAKYQCQGLHRRMAFSSPCNCFQQGLEWPSLELLALSFLLHSVFFSNITNSEFFPPNDTTSPAVWFLKFFNFAVERDNLC